MKMAIVLGSVITGALRDFDRVVHVDRQHIERDEPKIDHLFVAPAWKPHVAFKVKRIATPTGFFWVVKGDPSHRRFRLKADADAHLVNVEKTR